MSLKASSKNRITVLATLRNLALEPLFQLKDWTNVLNKKPKIVFINDIVLCPEGDLELLHQYTVQAAMITCGLDWNSSGGLFYDS